jgi:hypothetical protein
LNNIYLDKALSKPSLIKSAMKKLFDDIIWVDITKRYRQEISDPPYGRNI